MREGNGDGRGTLRLADARQMTPKVSATEAMRQQLQLALFGAVTEQDVVGMAAKLKEMALAGDLKAMKLFFQLVMGQAQPVAPVVQQAVVVHQQAQQEPDAPLPAEP